MSAFSESVRQQVRQRAGHRCEYCQSHQDYLMGWLQIDHILPVAKGGATVVDNLCLACELCNQYKWTQIDAIDPETQTTCVLFNPRHQRWCDHFSWHPDSIQIIGLTACGRATITALKLSIEGSQPLGRRRLAPSQLTSCFPSFTGNSPGAIADFQAYVDSPDIPAEQKTQRQAWIRDLQAGKNLVTSEVLDRLK